MILLLFSLHEGVKFLIRTEVNHGVCMGEFWRTEQAVNSSRRYVSATPVQRLLSQELVETTII